MYIDGYTHEFCKDWPELHINTGSGQETAVEKKQEPVEGDVKRESSYLKLFDTSKDFEPIDMDMSIMGASEASSVSQYQTEELPELPTTGYLGKILDTMSESERLVYQRGIRKCEYPTDLFSLIGCLLKVRGRAAKIPKSYRNAIYLCIYTKFAEVESRYQFNSEDFYRIYYEHLLDISDCSEFFRGVEADLAELFDKQDSPEAWRRNSSRNIRALLYNLRKVS